MNLLIKIKHLVYRYANKYKRGVARLKLLLNYSPMIQNLYINCSSCVILMYKLYFCKVSSLSVQWFLYKKVDPKNLSNL